MKINFKKKMNKREYTKKRRWIYVSLFLFLFFMLVMTIISRVVNEQYIPIIITKRVNSGRMEVNTQGKGSILYGIPQELLPYDKWSVEPAFYVRGYFYDKVQAENTSEGSKIKLSIYGMKEDVYGKIILKIYNYQTDVTEVILSLDEGDYVLGSEVDFVFEENKVRYDCIISKDVLYQDEGGYYVYVLKERENILGNTTIAYKLEVHIMAENDSSVAVEEMIDINTRLIVKDERLRDGMIVREKDY